MQSLLGKRKVRKLKPIQWALMFIFSTLVLAWMMIDTSSGIEYRHSVRHGDAANRVLHLDDAYRQKMQKIHYQLKAFCDRGSDIVFGHNLLINKQIFNDHVFHVCGGSTWLNAKIQVRSEKQVKCQEEFASIFRSVPRAKEISMKAIDVETWSEREVSGEGKSACVWQHAVDILERKWVGL
tara:strand:- start:126 stop:668 length:543 start_codon:yes stop_codon:yes gene_type:complete